jgi:phospholipase/carboxylesterase
MTLETIELSSADKPTAAVIWLHGLGADGHDFEALVPQLNLPAELPIRFIFPHAPHRAISLNNGAVMRSWYDISSLEFGRQEDRDGIHQSSAAIAQLIDHEISRGIASQRIVLAGFSQGGAIVLHSALRYPHPLAGVIALSTYLPLSNTLKNESSGENKLIPIFMAHGLQDDIVKYSIAVQSRNRLEQNLYPVAWHDYAMGHSVCADEIRDIRNWLVERLAN